MKKTIKRVLSKLVCLAERKIFRLKGKKILATMMTLALTIAAQGQQDDGLDDMMATMIATKVHQDSIDTSRLVAVYDYECRTQDADGKAVTDKMKLCVQVGQHCMRSFPYRKYRIERQFAAENLDLRNRKDADGKLEFMEGWDFIDSDEFPQFKAESYCFMPEVWTNFSNDMVTVRDAIVPTIYETREERAPIKWELIGGDSLATCLLHGRRWTVQYDEDIATTAGPWKLCGLPGLIVEAVSEDSIHRFTLTDVQHVAVPIYYETSAITVKTSEAKLIKNRIKAFGNRLYPKNPLYYVTDRYSADEVYTNDGTLINGYFVHYNSERKANEAHVYQPLEKE